MSQKKKELETKLFDKWTYHDIQVENIGLKRCISLKQLKTPQTMGRHEHKRLRKVNVNVVERLVNNLMQPGKNAGKKAKVMNIVKHAFDIMNLRTDRNPLQLLVNAIINAAPAEDTTRISYGGVVYHLSVDISPQRRVDLALRNIREGARRAALNNARSIEECLAEELILAANHDMKSYAVSRRHELERIAQASR